MDFPGLAGTDTQIAGAIERCHFALLQTRAQEQRGFAPVNPFFRKGRIGGGAEELQPETRAAIQRVGEPLYRAACALAAEAPARP